jgi:hypothetical protein
MTHSTAKARTHGGGGDAVLASAGLGDDALFAETLGEQDLAEGVVDLVSTGVQQILALEVDFGPAELFGPAFGEIERRGTTDVFVEQAVELFLEGGIGLGLLVMVGQLGEGRHERFRHEHAAVLAEVAVGVWHHGERKERGGGHGVVK